MIRSHIDFYNHYFQDLPNWSILEPFRFDKEKKCYISKALINSTKEDLKFEICIPEDYPFGEIKFQTGSISGFPHQNYDGSICLNTEFVNHIYTKLSLDVNKLNEWITKFYINDENDSVYEYPAIDYSGKCVLIFDESTYSKKGNSSDQFGEFQYVVKHQAKGEKNEILNATLIALGLGNSKYLWHDRFLNYTKYQGLWVLIEREPVIGKKERITLWEELYPLLPKGFNEFFRNFCNKMGIYKVGPKGFNDIVIALGYLIPGTIQKELHWDAILISKFDFPRKLKYSRQLLSKYSGKIRWEISENSSFIRFFGRGGFHEDIVNSKILVVGLGAVGSSLSEILVKGGAKFVDISDNDIVKPGNICRSAFSFSDIYFTKAASLKNTLESISPFVNISIIDGIKGTFPFSSDYSIIIEKLAEYDMIFDCTANNSFIEMLSNINLPGRIYYLSISNKAKELVCITNYDNRNISQRRNQMLYSLGNYHEEDFREGTGCWHPTFQASFFDINSLLNYTMRRINEYSLSNISPKSFYAYYSDSSIMISEDVNFYQPELDLSLKIESKCLKDIKKHVQDHFPAEIGGVLIGSYLNNYKDLVISQIMIPRKFNQGRYHFTPYHVEINQYLKEIYDKYNGTMEYLGDWHSHPNGSTKFSSTDLNAIKDIATTKTVNTYNPIMLIVSYDSERFELGFYVYNEGLLYKYEPVD